MLERARAALPELPAARAERFERDLGLTTDSARLLAWRAELGDYFEAALSSDGVEAQPLANWVNELVARIDVEDPAESKVAPGALATLVGLVSEKKVTQGAAKQVLDRLVAEGGDPRAIVEAEGLGAIGGGDELEPVVQAALDANPDIAERLRAGDMKPIGVDRRPRHARDARAAPTAARSRASCARSSACSGGGPTLKIEVGPAGRGPAGALGAAQQSSRRAAGPARALPALVLVCPPAAGPSRFGTPRAHHGRGLDIDYPTSPQGTCASRIDFISLGARAARA